jgi:replication factor C small subunit
MYIPWVEKYKPTNLSIFQNNKLLENIINNINSFNHCIFYGNSGCGKTTFIKLIIDTIYKSEKDKRLNTILLNASDERGIDTVRYKIKSFSKQTTYNNYPFKIVVLDEADNLTYEAQTALRRLIEKYSNNTRFCFICNYENMIINPIKSRCNLIKFNNFNNEYINKYLSKILKNEKIKNQKYDKIIELVISLAKGDMRKSIIYLETLTKIDIIDNNVDIIYELFGKLNKKYFKEELLKVNDLKDIDDFIEKFNSYSIYDILNIIIDIIFELNIKNEKIHEMILLLGEIDSIKNQKIDYDILLMKILSCYIKLKR